MSMWMIEPKSPVIFRDGKPFDTAPGARAKTLPFPHPSTIAGGLRTHAGPDEQGKWSSQRIAELLAIQMRGPLLAQRSADGSVQTWMLPAPADALVLRNPDNRDEGIRYWLRPLALPQGITVDLSDFDLVGPAQAVNAKPHPHSPSYWNWDTYRCWLEDPADDSNAVAVSTWGHNGPTMELRTHVRIDREKQTAEEGALFQTSGLEFMRNVHGSQGDGFKDVTFDGIKELALVVETDGNLTPGLAFLGGERRAVYWHKINETLPPCPPSVRQAIRNHKHCRLLLLTPACFEQGFLPRWLLTCIPGVTVTVVGAAVPRYQVVSGWDYEKKQPKPSRRLAPAGSVYYLKVEGSPEEIDQFIDVVWMQNVSDKEQDRIDGFGLAALGTWDGQYVNMPNTSLEEIE